jgi:hypothetical protein
MHTMYPCIYPFLRHNLYKSNIYQTFLNVTKDDLKQAANQLKENNPPASNQKPRQLRKEMRGKKLLWRMSLQPHQVFKH